MPMNPIIQFGHIVGLMPYDESSAPWGIQTDIVAVGGSSGSPIVDPNNGEVIERNITRYRHCTQCTYTSRD